MENIQLILFISCFVIIAFLVIKYGCKYGLKIGKDIKNGTVETLSKRITKMHEELDTIIEKLQNEVIVTPLVVLEGKKITHIGLVSESSDHCAGAYGDIATKEVMAKLLLKAWEMKANGIIGLQTSTIVEGGSVNGNGSIGTRILYTGTLVHLEG